MVPKITVIIPLYNKGLTISKTLESVLHQTFLDYEVIVINDGSTDNSVEKVKSFSDERIRLVTTENKGVSTARNLGIELANGKFVAFLDADDEWFPNHLQELHLLILDYPNCGMYCNRYKIQTTATHFQNTSFRGIEVHFRGIVENYFYSNKPFRIPTSSSVAISKKILDHFNGFESSKSSGEDIELWTRIAIEHPIAISNKCTVTYHFQTPNSLSKQAIDFNKIMNFTQFKNEEEKNPFLKEFLDLYRFFYAIQFKTMGKLEEAKLLYNQIDKKNIGKINQFLFVLPKSILITLYQIKRKIKQIGIEFSTYN